MSKLIIPTGIVCLLFTVFVYNEFTGNTIENYRLRNIAEAERFSLTIENSSTTRSSNLQEATGEIDDLEMSLNEGVRIEREINNAFDAELMSITTDSVVIDEFNKVYDENTI